MTTTAGHSFCIGPIVILLPGLCAYEYILVLSLLNLELIECLILITKLITELIF
jgi:hypothetical protein